MLNQNINIVYPNVKNMFMVPNHKNNEDYYENPCLSLLTYNFDPMENGGKKSFFYETKENGENHVSQ